MKMIKMLNIILLNIILKVIIIMKNIKSIKILTIRVKVKSKDKI